MINDARSAHITDNLASLLATLLEGHIQPGRRDATWHATVQRQRQDVRGQLALNPGLLALLDDPDWRAEIWTDVISQVADETGLVTLPTSCPWDLH